MPFRFVNDFSSAGPGVDGPNRAAWAKEHGLKPKDVLGLLKHSPIEVKGVTLEADDRQRDRVFSRMASKIAAHFSGAPRAIDAVIYAQSSSDMALDLAMRVADLLGARLVDDAAVKKSANELEVDPDELELFRQETKRGNEPGYVDKALRRTQAQIVAWRRSGRMPAMKDVPFEQRRFINLHKAGPGAAQLVGKVVLVVDDNVDKAETFRSISRELRAAGAAEVYHAAGWDYSAR